MNIGIFDFVIIGLFCIVCFFVFYKSLIVFKTIQFNTFFKAGGSIHWLLIGLAILGTNIQIEYILGSASNGFNYGLAYGSYEWTASFVLIFVALFVIPYFLRVGITTLPEYLGIRFNKNIRFFMALLFLLVNLGMLILILNSCAIFINKLFNIEKIVTILTVSFIGSTIIFVGGMKLKIQYDKIIITTFLISGIIVLYFSLNAIEGLNSLINNANGRLDVILSSDDTNLPWTSVFIGGLWINHLFYWAFFPPITQSALASDSLSNTQKGLLFAASVKLLIPFILILPGIVGYELYSFEISNSDFSLPIVIKHIIPTGLTGIIFLGYLGTLLTTFNGFINATAAIFSLDVYPFLRRKTTQIENNSIFVFRMFIPIFVLIAVIITSFFKATDHIFLYSQLLLVSVAPLITSIYLYAIFSRKTPTVAIYIVFIVGLPVFFILKELLDVSMLNLSGITFLILSFIMAFIRLVWPMKVAVVLPEKIKVKFERNLSVVIWGIFILTFVLAIYAIGI